MEPFIPRLVYFEPEALQYSLGKELYEKFKSMDIEIRETTSHNQVRGIPGETELQRYRNAKSTLVVGIRRTLKFDTSKPSAEYAIPLATGCMGHCHYCYLQTTLGSKPYIRVYVNLDEIFSQAKKYIDERAPEITRFEAACTSDIVGIDHLTHSLKKAIEFIGATEYGRLRFVTKYEHVDHLLDAKHNGKTTFRFSVNSRYVIRHFEPGTSSFEARMKAARKVARAGYPLGFIVAPIYRHDGWREGYLELFQRLSEQLAGVETPHLSFELIQHRFTKPAKALIQKRYPKTKLDLDESKRKYKWGRYGIGKYVYPDSEAKQLKETFEYYIAQFFPEAEIQYFT
ncbi:spore photoproduct lyase [Anoxybacillus sp. B7M1]|jgi:spore photoproduct lyase|uniref:spore photoproduct lyase n=1 Tax=unclassified Anoxybacillus TaxID=2639704 RepID=UPI0005CCE35E|nr:MULTISPECIES: spore photoproduct lyase [unclassified Anoxybacillus]ANB57598.1 spore photoproduct lyase [Anoxybacillus sp. B2M1]ANB63899.1 spore photoproduct lyase [Anoxybacillus sp. B7M1]